MSSDAESPDAGWSRLAVAVTLGVVVLDIVLPLLNLPTVPPSSIGATYVGFLMGQVGLHASLATLSRGLVVLRVLSVPLLAALMIWNAWEFAYAHDQFTIMSVLAGQWLTVALTMLVLIVCGCQLRRYLPVQLASDVRRTRPQFSLRRLIVLVTLVAAVAGVAIRIEVSELPEPFNQPGMLIVTGIFAVQPIVLVPCVLVPRRWWLPGLVAGVLAAGLGIGGILYWIQQIAVNFLVFVVPAVLQLGALVGMRLLGYRLWPLETRARPAAAVAVTGLGSFDGPIVGGESSALLDPES